MKKNKTLWTNDVSILFYFDGSRPSTTDSRNYLCWVTIYIICCCTVNINIINCIRNLKKR